MRPAAGLHPAAQEERASLAALEVMGQTWWERRRQEIAALPTVEWKGAILYALPCCGVSGRGPHVVNVPAALLWQLVSLRSYLCAFHAGDCRVTRT